MNERFFFSFLTNENNHRNAVCVVLSCGSEQGRESWANLKPFSYVSRIVNCTL